MTTHSKQQDEANSLTAWLKSYFVLYLISLNVQMVPHVANLSKVGWNWLWPVRWLSSVDQPTYFIFALFITLVGTLLVAIVKPYSQLAKACVLLLTFEVLAAIYSGGKIDHPFYGFLYSSLFIAFIRDPKDKAQNQFFIRCAQASFLLTYALAGIWKARFLGVNLMSGASLDNTLAFQVAIRTIDGTPLTLLGHWALSFPQSVQMVIWIGATIFEIAGLGLMLRPNWLRVWAIVMICFHLATNLLVSVGFHESTILLYLMFIANPGSQPVSRSEKIN
jgi:hypothetical protein